jgi:tetratricopeptide (TPR) repeat protein
MMGKSLFRGALLICIAAASLPLWGDALSDLPVQWQGKLTAIPESDVSGAEPLMQDAIREARREVAKLLRTPEPDPALLAAAYGRLGALFVLTEVEAQADACLRNAHSLQPREFRWPYYAGYVAMMAGNTDRALAYLQAAEAIDPTYPTLYLRLGRVWLERSELAKAQAAFERIAAEPGLVVAANYYLGQIANLQRRYADAVTYLEKALQADPGATGVHYPLAQAYRALGKDDLARKHLGEFEVHTPDAKDPLLEQLQSVTKRSVPAFEKAIYAVRQGDYATAATRFGEGLAVAPDNVAARVSYARVLYLVGKKNDAGKELAAALAADPNEVLANFLQGVLLQDQGRNDEAVESYRRTLELDPKQAGAYFYLANLDFAAGRYADAVKGYHSALTVDKEIPPARLLELVARNRAGDSEAKTAQALDNLSAQHPHDPQIRYALARLLAAATDPKVRDPSRALALASRLAQAQPIPPHLRVLALAQAANGDFKEAAQTQQQAIATAAWMAPPEEVSTMTVELEAYNKGKMPTPAWPPADPLLSPPPFDPVAPFRDYPASVPY